MFWRSVDIRGHCSDVLTVNWSIKTDDEMRNDCPLSTPLNCNLFKGGQINLHSSQWKELTADRNILNMVKGNKLKDVTTYPADLFPIFSQGSKKPKDWEGFSSYQNLTWSGDTSWKMWPHIWRVYLQYFHKGVNSRKIENDSHLIRIE